MVLRNSLLLAPLNNLNSEEFRNNYYNLELPEQEFFLKKILNDKYSPIFLNYINKNNLQDIFIDQELTSLKEQSKRFQVQSLEIVKELIYINKLFKKNSLNPIYLKGSALMNEYSDISLRPAVDIDIFFEGEEVFNAYKILYENLYNEPGLIYRSKKELKEYIKNNHHLPPLYGESNIMIEIHCRITREVDFKDCPLSQQVVKNKRSVNFYGSNINIPSIEDIIVHQLIHFSLNSRFNNLLRIFSDIRQLEKNYIIDWKKIYNKNKDEKIRKALSLSLEILNYHFTLTNRFIDLKNHYGSYFPENEVVLEAYNKTFDLKKRKMNEELLYKLGKENVFRDFLKIIFSRKIFLSAEEIISEYNISKPNYSKVIYFRILSFFSRFANFWPLIINLFLKKGTVFQDFKSIKRVEDWLN